LFEGREISTNFARLRLEESGLHFAFLVLLEIWAVSNIAKILSLFDFAGLFKIILGD